MKEERSAATMPAVVLTGHGGPDRLAFHRDWPRPEPGPGQVRIKVGACGLNNTDVNTRTAWYSKGMRDATTGVTGSGAAADDAAWGGSPITFPRIQGADVAGVVEALGAGTDPSLLDRRVLIDPWLRRAPGDFEGARYFGSECDGGFAGFTCVDAAQVYPVASDLSDAELATFPTSSMTALNMLRRTALRAGETLLVTGASGGVGSALIQLGIERGARVIALAGDDKAEAVAALGAHAVLPRNPDNLGAALRDATGRKTVDAVADVVGGTLWPQLLDVLIPGGRYACSGAIAGPIVEFDLRSFYLKDLTLVGATVAPASVFAELVDLIERGRIHPLLAAAFPLEQFADAQRMFLAKQHVGNIVVVPGHETP